jgi:hypothetical protein
MEITEKKSKKKIKNQNFSDKKAAILWIFG